MFCNSLKRWQLCIVLFYQHTRGHILSDLGVDFSICRKDTRLIIHNVIDQNQYCKSSNCVKYVGVLLLCVCACVVCVVICTTCTRPTLGYLLPLLCICLLSFYQLLQSCHLSNIEPDTIGAAQAATNSKVCAHGSQQNQLAISRYWLYLYAQQTAHLLLQVCNSGETTLFHWAWPRTWCWGWY